MTVLPKTHLHPSSCHHDDHAITCHLLSLITHTHKHVYPLGNWICKFLFTAWKQWRHAKTHSARFRQEMTPNFGRPILVPPQCVHSSAPTKAAQKFCRLVLALISDDPATPGCFLHPQAAHTLRN